MFGGNFKLTADMIFYEFSYKFVVFVFHKVVIAYSRTYENTLYALYLTDFSENFEIFGVVSLYSGAGSGGKAFFAHTKPFA